MSSTTVLLTATVQPSNVIYCDRRDVEQRLRDYLLAFRFWLGESQINRILLVENSGFDLHMFNEFAEPFRERGKKVELLSFVQAPFDKNLGKSYGESRILAHALAASALLQEDTFILKGTGRYRPINFFRVWPKVRSEAFPFVLANFYDSEPGKCDSRYFGAHKDFLADYFLPATAAIDDSRGYFLEHALAAAVRAAERDGKACRPFPGGGLLVDGVQGSTNTAFPYPLGKRLLYRAVASVRNGIPFQFTVGAPVWRPGQGSSS